jgi:hypothetical protein
MQPLSAALSASHFKRTGSNMLYKWTPCSPSDPAAVPMTLKQVQNNELLVRPLTIDDFLLGLESTRPTVTKSDIKLHEEWTEKYGVSDFSLLHL